MGILKRRMNSIIQDVDGMKVDFQGALIEKGVEDPGNSLPEYPEKILEIETGGGGGGEELPINMNRVRFFDWNWTLLKEEIVENGQGVTPPDNPTPPAGWGMTFSDWGVAAGDLDAVYCDMDIVAQYTSDETLRAVLRIEIPAGGTFYLPYMDAVRVKWTEDGAWEDYAAGSGIHSHVYGAGYSGYVFIQADALTLATIALAGYYRNIKDMIVLKTLSSPIYFGFNYMPELEGLYFAKNVTQGTGSELSVTATALSRLNAGGATKVSLNVCYLKVAAFPAATSVTTGSSSYNGGPAFVERAYYPVMSSVITTAPSCEHMHSMCTSVFGNTKSVLKSAAVGQPSGSAQTQNHGQFVVKAAGNQLYGSGMTYTTGARSVVIVLSGANPSLANSGTAWTILSQMATARHFAVKIDPGEELTLNANITIAGRGLTDMADWTAFFNSLKSGGSTSITINSQVYNIMPDSVKNLAISKGYTLASS